jgi:DNA repair exonuclease SbcCD nuclease subunit
MLLIAHVSDTHIGRRPEAVERTERVMRYLHGLRRPVDAVLVTGRSRGPRDRGRI